jgi:hypothetical protein
MSNEMLRSVIAVLVVAHGIGHILFLISSLGLADWGQSTRSWLLTDQIGDKGARAVGSLLWLGATAGFVVAGLALLAGWAWWRPLSIVSAAISLLGLILFLSRRLTQPAVSAALFDAFLLVALVGLDWPPTSLAAL